jgi:serine/threonine protein kinase
LVNKISKHVIGYSGNRLSASSKHRNRSMILTCPHCRRSLSSSDEDVPPSFCMYCGHKLRDIASPSAARDMQTLPYTPSETELDDDPNAPERIPTNIGGYRLLRLLGSGGMGTVYEAESPQTGNRVAIKLLSQRMAASPTSVERFKQEGRLASQLAHPRCVFVIAADTDDGRPYIIMELMPGRTLKDVVQESGPCSPEVAIRHILDAIDGLGEAHRVGVIHRDMKPSNCFLTIDNRVKVGDFGLSKSLAESDDKHLTQTGAFLGTVLFASPEQIRGEPLDYSSDVYSVCATLYYLLCGEAPYHHESPTAALAKAISEDPPPLHEKQPSVPRRLEQIAMKGLERDRERRWHSLDDLREALVNLLPSRRHPARPRALIGAYILDRIAISFLILPIEIVRQWINDTATNHIDFFEIHWVSILVMLCYFTCCEGLLGATPGKWLLSLRVSRLGQTNPPGIGRAFARTTIFHLLLIGVSWVPEQLIVWFKPMVGGFLGGMSFLLTAAALLIQLRKKWGYRGLHDFATECHVTQNPLPSRKLRLLVQSPTPLQTILPPPAESLPKRLGSYTIRGRIAADTTGEQIWVGEDGALSRLVLIWLRPANSGTCSVVETSRPSRIRRLSGGSLAWSGAPLDWTAFAAPLGCPLTRAIDPKRSLPWADARYLLEQLVEELLAAEEDGTMPLTLALDQLWVEPNGRIQLLDFSPLYGSRQKSLTPIALLREVSSLALEGRARNNQGMVRAPMPPHAVPILNRLFTDGGYPTLSDIQRELTETQNNQPEVTSTIRTAQIGIQAAIVGLAILMLFVLTFCMQLLLTYSKLTQVEQVDAALGSLADPEKRAKLATYPGLEGPLKNPNTVRRLERLREHLQNQVDFRRSMLFSPQKAMLKQIEEHAPPTPESAAGYPVAVREAVQWAGADEHTTRGKALSPWGYGITPVLVSMLVIPVGLILGSALFRGGISLMLAGIALVRADGMRATRRQCAFRTALVWLPVVILLYGSTVLQILAADQSYLAAVLWLLALALLPIYIAVAIRFPIRAPQDRIVGTYLVPA